MKDTKPQILYVEDDENLGFVTKDNLDLKGYSTTYYKNGKEGLDAFKKGNIDLCILDVMLPEMDGFTLAREIRKINSDVPIIFLTAKTMKEDKIAGFQTGADDYITKPFSIEELILRIEVFLKRSKKADIKQDEPSIFELGKYQFNFHTLTLSNREEKYTLTMKEAELLRLFCMNRDKILRREEILRAIWGDDDYFMGRSLDVFISRLRKLLQKDADIHIENAHGIGFKLSIDN